MNSISQAVIATDLEGRVTYWNSFATTLYGWSEQEALGGDIYELTVGEKSQADAQAIMAQLARGEAWTGEFVCQGKGGTRFPVFISDTPIFDSNGRLIGILGVSWDITERKFTEEILENQARQMALINQVGGQINGVLDMDHALNRAAQLVQSTFNYEHVGLFILDEESHLLVMRARDGIYASRFARNHSLALGEGIVGWVAEQGRRLLANDVDRETHYRNPFADETIKSELAVPIRVGDEMLGVLDVQSQDLNAFDQTDILVLETLADQLATAIQNARLYEAERRQRELAEAQSKLAAILASTLEPDEVLERILSHVGHVLPHDAANIYLLEGDEGHYVCWQGYTPEMEPHLRQRTILNNSNALLASMSEGEIILLPETEGAPNWPTSPALGWIHSHLGVPIRYMGKVFGYLSLDSAIPRHFTHDDAQRLQAIADQAAMAIQNARLYQAEREQRHMAEALREMAALMSSTLEMEGIIPHVLPFVKRIIPHDAASIMLFEENKAHFVIEQGHPKAHRPAIEAAQADIDGHPLLRRVANGELILIPDTAEDPNWFQSPRAKWVRSYVSVPIRGQGVVLGSLNLDSRNPHQFIQTDVDHLQAIADQVAVAFRNARLYQAEREQRQMAEALRDLAAVLSSTLEPEAVLKQMLEQIGRVIQHDASVLLLIEDGEAYIAQWRGFPSSSEAYLRSTHFSLELSDLQQMLLTGEPVIIADTTTYPDWIGGSEIAWVRCQLSVPIRYQNTTIGFLSLDNAQPNSFTPRDAQHLQAIADQAAMAIQNARLYQAEREQHRLTEALRDMAASISGTLSITELLLRLLENVGRVVPHDRANIMLISGSQAEVAYVHGYSPEVTEAALKIRFSLETPNLARMMESGEPFIIPDTRAYEGWIHVEETADVCSYIGVPIQARSAVIGFLSLDSYTPNFFNEEHAANLLALVHQASVAIQNARLYQDLEMYSESLELAVRDRTVELNRSRERVEAILNGSSDAIIFLDPEGSIRQANPAFNALFGYDVDEVFGNQFTALAAPEHTHLLTEAIQTSSAQAQAERVEITARRKDGFQFDADVALSPVRSGTILLGLVCSLRDITARKASEQALKDALEKERELGQLKSRFVSMASHEFRTPLTTILSSTFLLENCYERMSEEQKVRHFQKIKASIQHMNQLLEDVLTIGTAEAGRLEFNPEPLNLDALCREAVEEIQLGTQTHVFLPSHPIEDNQVIMDGKLLRQILDNLLSNAIKYSPQGGSVQMDVQCGRRMTTIRVKDEGIGIPESDRKHLFEPFNRGGNVAGIQGTGLGLAITKRSVDIHQGSLTYESHEGVGMTFTVILPIVLPSLDSTPDD